MQKWRIRQRALASCSALIQVNAELGDGDLYRGLEDWSERDIEKFQRECMEISNLLSRKARHIASSARVLSHA